MLALAGAVLLRGDRRFTKIVSGYLLVAEEADHVKSVEARTSGEAGAGITWLDEKDGALPKVELRTDLAFRYANERRHQYYPVEMAVPSVDLIAPRLGVHYRYALSKDVIFTEDAEAMPNVVGAARLVADSTSKLDARLTGALSLGVTFVVATDSAPAPGKVATDTATSIALQAAF